MPPVASEYPVSRKLPPACATALYQGDPSGTLLPILASRGGWRSSTTPSLRSSVTTRLAGIARR